MLRLVNVNALPRYHPFVPANVNPGASLALNTELLRPGMRVAVALSGGADSVALLRVLVERSAELGLVVHAAHLHHGLRGVEADGDLEFSRSLANQFGLDFHESRVDVGSEAQGKPETGKAAETIEEAARRVRYAWFRQLLASGVVDAVATAHTLDDQAETVLAKFLRGAWTEGLSGIAPVLDFPEGRILRPLLGVTRTEIEAYLRTLGQLWREDSSNRHLTFTRNRIRHELLPRLEDWNPRLREHLSQMATLARDEEAWWNEEVSRIAPHLILQGRPVRGGGRAASGGLSIELTRFKKLAPALQRRILRHAAEKLGADLDSTGTESLLKLAITGRAGQKCELERLRAERTVRELRLESGSKTLAEKAPVYRVPIPGECDASAFGFKILVEDTGGSADGRIGTLRSWASGDRVRLRYSGGPKKVKEILERMHVTGSDRVCWPVLELEGQIVWMRGVELEPVPGLMVKTESLDDSRP